MGLEGLVMTARLQEAVDRDVLFGSCILSPTLDIAVLLSEFVVDVGLDIPGSFGLVARGAEPDSLRSFLSTRPYAFVYNVVDRACFGQELLLGVFLCIVDARRELSLDFAGDSFGPFILSGRHFGSDKVGDEYVRLPSCHLTMPFFFFLTDGTVTRGE